MTFAAGSWSGCTRQLAAKRVRSSKKGYGEPGAPELETNHREMTYRDSHRATTHQPVIRGDHDELREYLREWRRTVSKEMSIPAFIVMHDTTLDELCRARPNTLAQLRNVSGFGDRKVEMYGQQILAALKTFGSRAKSAAQ